MIKYQKKTILTKVGEPLFIQHKATATHNEVTVAVVEFALPLNALGLWPKKKEITGISPALIESIKKATASWQGNNIEFNWNPANPAYLFKVTAKTERRGEDKYNQEFANKIVISKAYSKAYRIAKRIMEVMVSHHSNIAVLSQDIVDLFDKRINREVAYFERANTTGTFKS